MASDLSDSQSEYEDIVRHSVGKTSTFYDSMCENKSDDHSCYEDLGEFSLKHNEKKDRQNYFTYPSIKTPTRKKEDTFLQKTKKTTEEIGDFVGKKCTKLKKCVGSFKHKGKESAKPLSVSECLSSKPEPVTNTYQPDVTRPKLPQRNRKTYVRPPATETTLTSPSHYMSMTYKPTEEKTADYQNSIPKTGALSEQSNELVAEKDDRTEPDNDYLRPEPRQTGLYRNYLLKKQKEIERQKMEIIEEEPCLDNLEKVKKTKTSESDDDSDYEKLEISAEHLPGTSAGNESKKAINDSSKEEKSLDNSSGSKEIESERPDIERLNIKGVIQVLKDLDLEKYADIFEANKVGGLLLTRLKVDDFIKELGMKKLDAFRLDNFIKYGYVPS